jgi:hypothetical protein
MWRPEVSNNIAVVERYPDGTKWVHYFPSRHDAEQAVEANKEWHPARTYEIRETV